MGGSANSILRLEGNATPQEKIDLTHPGFTISCNKCQSKLCVVESDLGFSEISGSWGAVRCRCLICGSETVLFE